MLYAYCDESYTGNLKTTPIYVVAGFIGPAHRWELFNSLWRRTMKDLGIEAIGCHANRCACGAKPYGGMTVEERNEIQYRLIVDIAASGLFGVTSFVDMEAFRKHRQGFRDALMPEARQYNEAHIHAVRQCIQHMCLITEEATVEPITFVVDRNQEFGKRAKAWYEASQKNPTGAGRHNKRFGPYFDGERMRDVGLQAADLLAYAALRHELGKPCWQWETMMSGVKIGRPFTSGEKFWSDVAEFSRERMGEEAEA